MARRWTCRTMISILQSSIKTRAAGIFFFLKIPFQFYKVRLKRLMEGGYCWNWFSISILQSSIKTGVACSVPLCFLISILQSSIKTVQEPTEPVGLQISILQSSIKTWKVAPAHRSVLLFQFYKVRLKPSRRRPISTTTARFQFYKVRLKQ